MPGYLQRIAARALSQSIVPPAAAVSPALDTDVPLENPFEQVAPAEPEPRPVESIRPAPPLPVQPPAEMPLFEAPALPEMSAPPAGSITPPATSAPLETQSFMPETPFAIPPAPVQPSAQPVPSTSPVEPVPPPVIHEVTQVETLREVQRIEHERLVPAPPDVIYRTEIREAAPIMPPLDRTQERLMPESPPVFTQPVPHLQPPEPPPLAPEPPAPPTLSIGQLKVEVVPAPVQKPPAPRASRPAPAAPARTGPRSKLRFGIGQM